MAFDRETDIMRIGKKIQWMEILLCVLFLTGCGGGKVRMASAEIVFTNTLSENEVFKVESKVCTLSQAKLFLVNEKNQYEEAFGAELWKQKLEGQTMEEYIRNIAQNQLAQLKAMVLLAENRQLGLSEAEQEQVKKATEEYFSSLTTEEIEILHITKEEIQQFYEEYCLADKLYQELTSQVEEEISDSEARVIVVQHIFLKKAENTEEEKQELQKRLKELKNQAEDGSSFSSLAAEYSDDRVIEYSFGRGEMEQAFEEAAFSLAVGEISDVVETSSGYHLIYCVNDYDVDKTTTNKTTIIERRKQAAFDQVYQAFSKELISEINEKVWNSINFDDLVEVTTKSLFEVYEENMES